MDLDTDFSCDGFIPTDTTSSLQIGMAYEPCPRSQPFAVHSQSKSPIHSSEEKCASGILSSSSSSTVTSALFAQNGRMQKLPPPRAPNIDYELSVAQSIMQQYSSISGDNL